MIGIVFLIIAGLIGFMVFHLGRRAEWHWAAALGAAVIPVVFVYFLGIIGIMIAGAFLAAIWKVTA